MDIKNKKTYRFHYVSMPHLPVTKEYLPCAFTQKIHKLTRMLLDKGHEVFLYGVDRTDIEHPNLEFIPVVDINDVRKDYGSGDNRFELGYDPETGFRHDINKAPTPSTIKFRKNAITEINKRKKDSDFLLLSQGSYQKPIADKVGLYLTCEPGIGYRGSYAPFRAFESAYIQNFTYGSENPRKSINGAYYDRVIPNYFDMEEFGFSDTPEDYLLYIGRLIPRKGVVTAMKTAEALGEKLVIAGQGSLEDIPYSYDNVEYVGMVGVEERKELYKNAKACFLPTLYLEPFGGTSVEAMLSGCPAITTNFGVFPETIRTGVGGYRCDTLNDFVNNTKKAFELDRSKVRDYAVERYSMEAVNEMFEKWWNDLHRLYQSTRDKDVKAWHHVELK